MNKPLLAAIVATCVLATQVAFAQAYIGGAIGPSASNNNCGGVACGTNDSGFKLFGGVKFMPQLSAELSYSHLGATQRVVVAHDSHGTTHYSPVQTTGWGVGLAGFPDFGRDWAVATRVGLVALRTEMPTLGDYRSPDERLSPYMGFGIGYFVSRTLSIDAALDLAAFDLSDRSAHIGMITIGLTQSF